MSERIADELGAYIAGELFDEERVGELERRLSALEAGEEDDELACALDGFLAIDLLERAVEPVAASEHDATFDAAWQARQVTGAEVVRPWFWGPGALMGGVAFAAAASIVFLLVSSQRGEVERIKSAQRGAESPRVELTAFAGTRGVGAPVLGRQLSDQAALRPGEMVLFRYHVTGAASLELVELEPDGASSLWRSAGDVDGTGEVSAGGKVLALDPSSRRGVFELALIACAERPAGVEGQLAGARSVRDVIEVFAGCDVSSIQLEAAEVR